MGKPYTQDLARLSSTVHAAAEADIAPLVTILRELARTSLIAVGSGGSLTAAHFAAMLHEQWASWPAKAVSPLEAASRPSTRDTAALLLTARGTNPDILRAFDVLLASGCSPVAALCARRGSPLARQMRARSCPLLFEFPVAAGRDGFLATNSLLASTVYLIRGYASLFGFDIAPLDMGFPPRWYDIDKEQRRRLEQALSRETVIVLSSGWGWIAAIDLESKFSECALAHAILSDFRNFAHGRHVWLARRGSRTSVITLETPENQRLAARTVKLLPAETVTFPLTTERSGPLGAIDLLTQVMFLVHVAAKLSGVDPGQPAVPKFGRRLYWSGMPFQSRPKSREIWVARKALAMGFLGNRTRPVVEKALSQYVRRLGRARFGGMVTDYDGTLCDPGERYTRPSAPVGKELARLLREGLVLGIATGRGRSVHRALRELLPDSCWPNAVLGLYNGATICSLAGSVPASGHFHPSIQKAAERLGRALQEFPVEMECRPDQLSILPTEEGSIDGLYRLIAELLYDMEPEVRVLASSHSVDVVSPRASKLKVLDEVRRRLQALRKSDSVLCIGDRGDRGGNDFDLLASGLSLSVDRVSARLDSCWHLGPPEARGSGVVLVYLRALEQANGGFRLNVAAIEKSVTSQ